ncbi:MAG TPA: arsenate reductase ArsC [Candidatus Eisenbacteria bacterium]|nr:arsenate reductase ArsC [Candidatus Eisenbacteria bacterium]
MHTPFNVLFLCTGNSSRSILAEAILRHRGEPRFHAYSAGSHPAGRVHPGAVEQLQSVGLPLDGLRSKSWDEFTASGAPRMNFVFTVCDAAAAEVCPVWPGQPVTAHWGIPDPGNAPGGPEALRRAFRDAYVTLGRRIDLFLSLPLDKLDSLAVQKEVDRIGKM